MSFDQNIIVNLSAISPVVSQEQFATFLGVTPDTVRGWIENDTLPHVKLGRQRFINVIVFVDDLKNGKTIFSRGDYGND
ncbi:helix-turn-helix domain-containing protein [Cellvibrio fontiphilus]|uniref:Helix-turn-helix domain-containing protein n=1 Tax=Cellvibrio fontiphilus TaxID=1815559 RepID=A0ABV7FH50_9GAMM